MFIVRHWLGAGVLSCARQCGKLHEKRTGFELWVLLGHGISQLKPKLLGFAVCKCSNDWHKGGQVRAHVGFAWDYIATHAFLWHLIVSFSTPNPIPLSGTSIHSSLPVIHFLLPPNFWDSFNCASKICVLVYYPLSIYSLLNIKT